MLLQGLEYSLLAKKIRLANSQMAGQNFDFFLRKGRIEQFAQAGFYVCAPHLSGDTAKPALQFRPALTRKIKTCVCCQHFAEFMKKRSWQGIVHLKYSMNIFSC